MERENDIIWIVNAFCTCYLFWDVLLNTAMQERDLIYAKAKSRQKH